MDIIFMKSENSKTSRSHVLILNLMIKYICEEVKKVLLYQILVLTTRIYVNEIKNRIVLKIKTRYYLELLIPERMNLLGSTENKITKDNNGENVPHLEITEVVLAHCNIVNNDFQQDLRVLYIFVPNKPFGSLLEMWPANFIFLNTFNSEFEDIEVCFTDKNSQPLEIDDRINLTLVIKWQSYYKNALFNWTQKLNICKRL